MRAGAGGVRDTDGGDPVVAGAAGGAVRVPLLRAVPPGLLRGVPVLLLRQVVRAAAAGAGGVRVQELPDLQRRGPDSGVQHHVMVFSGVLVVTSSAQWPNVYGSFSVFFAWIKIGFSVVFAQIGGLI